MAEDTTDRMRDLLRRLVRVPKREIDEQERERRDEHEEPAKPREIVTVPHR